MIEMSVSELAAAVGAQLAEGVDGSVIVSGSVRLDSRLVQLGDVFVAVPGERHDGHNFLSEVRGMGAVAAIVTDPAATGGDLPLVRVDDETVALGRLAAHVRDQLVGIRVLAITGSSGKTTTKDLLAATLAGFGDTVAAHGSFNNDVGLPMTVLEAETSTRYLVLEMGARAAGDIARLCRIARPDVGIVLNVGSAHVGEFGSRDLIGEAKGELVEGLTPQGVAVLNADDPVTAAMSSRARGRVLTFGLESGADLRGTRVELDDRGQPSFDVEFDGDKVRVRLRAVGRHQVPNGLAVIGGCLSVGVSLEAAAAALEQARVGSPWRMEVIRTAGGAVVINDAYNANPESMSAALRALVAVAGSSETCAVIGSMRELGELSVEAHRDIGRLAGRLGVNRVVAVGEEARPVLAGLDDLVEWSGTAEFAADCDEALGLLRGSGTAGAVVLVKASRALGLERLALDLVEAHGGPARIPD